MPLLTRKRDILDALAPLEGPDQLDYIYARSFDLVDGWQVPWRQNDHCRLQFITRGSGMYRIGPDRERVELKRGTVMFLGEGEWHQSQHPEASNLQTLTIRFHVRGGEQGRRVLPMPYTWVAHPRHVSDWERRFNHVIEHHGHTARLFSRQRQATLLSLLMDIGIEGTQEDVSRDGLEQVYRYLHAHPGNTDDMASLAKRAQLSPTYFTKAFKQRFGITPKSLQVKLRCEYAKELLLEGNLSAKSIAYMLGYQDHYGFYKQFRDVMGESVRAVKKNLEL